MVQPAIKQLAGTKRRADQDSDAMTNKEAATAFRRLLLAVPKRLKKQSLYVRFKYLLLQDASVNGEKDKIANITELAKEKWKIVKGINTQHFHDKENVDAYLVDVKRRAEEEQRVEDREHSKVFTEWCERFQTAASAHLTFLATEANESNYKALKDAVQKVEGIQEWSEHVPKFHLFALVKAKEELTSIQETVAEKTMVAKLHKATVSELYQHVKDYREMEEKLKELGRIKAELTVLRDKQDKQDRMEQENDQRLAETLVGDVIKNLETQMVYVASLNTQSKRVVYQRSGVKPQVFCKAFNIPTGSKKTIISSREVPCKTLRHGASLECGNVEVKINSSNVVVATAWYTMHAHPSRFLY